MHKFFLMIAVIATSLIVISCTQNDLPSSDRLQIVATFYPLAHIAQEVGGDIVSVYTVTPVGTEPHDYEPTPKDIEAIYNADVFLVNGDVDAWTTKITDFQKTTVITMRTALGIENLDPHFWLDPVLLQQEVAVVLDTFTAKDPAHRADYAANADAYSKKLQALDAAYAQGLAACAQNVIVTSHDAFGYLAQRYHFTVLPIAGFSPDEEPSPRDLAELATLARTKNISVIFFESLVSPRLAQTLATEIGAHWLVLNPLEGLTDAEIAAGDDYISVMHKNLTNLRIALACT